MDNVDLHVLKRAEEWHRAGRRLVLATVVRTWGSAPRPIGSILAIRDDGLVAGSVSGGCIEDDLVDKVRAGAFLRGAPRLLRYGIGADEAFRFGLPCGGTIELVIEPVGEQTELAVLVARMSAGHHTIRTLDFATGKVTLSDGGREDVLYCDDQIMVTSHGPAWRMLLIGAGQLSHYLAQFALAVDFAVTICDPREEYADGWLVPGAELVRTMPDDTVLEMRCDTRTAVIALTHDPKLDDMALIEALASDSFYVGAIGSRRNQAKRRERLLEFGLTTAQLDRLHGPVGIKNGASTPSEIAVSILAEVISAKRGYALPPPVQLRLQGVVEVGCVH